MDYNGAIKQLLQQNGFSKLEDLDDKDLEVRIWGKSTCNWNGCTVEIAAAVVLIDTSGDKPRVKDYTIPIGKAFVQECHLL